MKTNVSVFSESSVNAYGWILSMCWWVLPPGRKVSLTDTHAHREPWGSVPGAVHPLVEAEGRAWEEGQLQSSSGTNVLWCPQMTFMLPKHLIWRFNRLSDMWTPKLMLCYLGDTDWNSAQGSQGSPAERSARSTLEMVVHQLHDDGVTIKHSRGNPEMRSMMSTHLKRTLSYQEQCRRQKHTSSGPEFP